MVDVHTAIANSFEFCAERGSLILKHLSPNPEGGSICAGLKFFPVSPKECAAPKGKALKAERKKPLSQGFWTRSSMTLQLLYTNLFLVFLGCLGSQKAEVAVSQLERLCLSRALPVKPAEENFQITEYKHLPTEPRMDDKNVPLRRELNSGFLAGAISY